MKHSLINESLKKMKDSFLLSGCLKNRLVLILICAILVASIFPAFTGFCTSIEDIKNPRESKQWVIDDAKVWNQETEKQLEKSLFELELKNKTEFAIVTVPNILAGTDLRPMARALRKRFHIGKPELDNGLLLLVSKRPEKLIGVVSKGSGIPTNYFQADVSIISDDQLNSIQKWLPRIIDDLSKVSYQSKPTFRQIYQAAGGGGLLLFVMGFTGFEYVVSRLKMKYKSRNNLSEPSVSRQNNSSEPSANRFEYIMGRLSRLNSQNNFNEPYVDRLVGVHVSLFSIGLGKILSAISLSTFLLSKSPISGGLNTGKSDFLWVIVVGLSVLPVYIIPNFWLLHRTGKISLSDTRVESDNYHVDNMGSRNILHLIKNCFAIKFSDSINTVKMMLLIIVGIWTLFCRAAYSDIYDGWLSPMGTAPILEFSLILFLLISSFIFISDIFSADSRVEELLRSEFRRLVHPRE